QWVTDGKHDGRANDELPPCQCKRMNANCQLLGHDGSDGTGQPCQNHIPFTSELETELQFLPPVREHDSDKSGRKSNAFFPGKFIIRIKEMCQDDREKSTA